jgi:peptidoglycan hydrolase-like protein with peptidoglycan-binding domain
MDQGMTPLMAQQLAKGVISNLPKHLAQTAARRGFTAGMFGSSTATKLGSWQKALARKCGG